MTIGYRCLAMLASGSLLCVSLPGVASAAAATKVPNQGSQCPNFLFPGSSSGDVWTSEDGVIHTRNLIGQAIQTGDFDGTVTLIQDSDVDSTTCQGRAHAVGVFEGFYTPTGQYGTFDATAEGEVGGFPNGQGGCVITSATTKAVAQGHGDFEGWKRFNTLTFPDPNARQCPFPVPFPPGFILVPGTSWAGYVLDPSGQLQP